LGRRLPQSKYRTEARDVCGLPIVHARCCGFHPQCWGENSSLSHFQNDTLSRDLGRLVFSHSV
jgi:hypothetical protein